MDRATLHRLGAGIYVGFGVTDCFDLAVAIFILRLALRDLSAIWRWSPRSSLLAMAGVCVSVFGGVVMEAIGYKFMEYGTPLYKIEVAIEESMEMLGASLILYSTVLLASSVIKSIILEA